MIYQFILSHSVPLGPISTTFFSRTQTLGAPGEWISSSVWTSSLQHCCMAGRLDHLVLQLHLRPCLGGYLQVQPINPPQDLLSPLTIRSSLPVMTYYADSGRSRRIQNTNQISQQKKDPLSKTLRRAIIVPPMGDSSYHCRRSPMLYLSVNQGRMLCGDSCHSNVLCVLKAFDSLMQEYFDVKHAEPVPTPDLDKPPQNVFYLPMHAVKKESSSTTKIRAVFDASAKSSSNVSLNDILLVGPTVHSSLIDVLLRFRLHQIALTADVSKMYRAIELVDSDRDLHRFVWRSDPDNPLQDYRMTRVIFGVSASSFAANMSVKRSALDHTVEFPKAANAVETAFYVDDCLTGTDSVEEAIDSHHQLLNLFTKGGFLLRKWNSSHPKVLCHIDPELCDVQSTHFIPSPDEYTKALGIQWNGNIDHFRPTVSSLQDTDNMTKRALVSDITKTYDVLGWFSPSIIKAKILLQRVWELKIGWDDLLP